MMGSGESCLPGLRIVTFLLCPYMVEREQAPSLVSLLAIHAQSLQSCLTLCDPMDYSWPGSSVCGILQERILEWIAMPSSKGSS